MVKTKWSVVLTNVTLSKAKAVQLVRQRTSLSITEAISLIRNLPAVLVEGLEYDEADDVRDTLQAAGATVEIQPTPRKVAEEEVVEVLRRYDEYKMGHCLVRESAGSDLSPKPLGPDGQPRSLEVNGVRYGDLDLYGFDPLVHQAIVPYLLKQGAPVFVWDDRRSGIVTRAIADNLTGDDLR